MLKIWTMFDKPVFVLWLIGLTFVRSPAVNGQELLHVGELQRDIVNASQQRSYFGNWGHTAVLSVHQVICPPASCQNTTLYYRDNFRFLSDVRHSLGGCCQFCACQKDCEVEERHIGQVGETERPTTAASMDTECISPQIWSYTSGRQNESPLVSPIVMVNTYQGGDSLSNEVQKCTNPNARNLVETIPATSLDTGKTYWNRFCARCNGDSNVVLWDPVLHIPAQLFVHDDDDTAFPRFQHILDEMLERGPSTGNVTYSAPDSVVFTVQQQVCITERPVIDACNMTGLWPEELYDPVVEEACLTKKVKYEVDDTVYRNFFCFLCNAGTVPSMRGRVSRPCNISLVPSLPQQGTISGRLNMAAVESGDSGQSLTKSQAGNTAGFGCVWDPYKLHHRPVYCARGKIVINCTCIPLLADISGMTMALKIRVNNNTEMQENIEAAMETDSLKLLIDSYCEEVSKRMHNILIWKLDLFGYDSFVKSSHFVPVVSIVCIVYVTPKPAMGYSRFVEVLQTALSPQSIAFDFRIPDSVDYTYVYPDASLFFAHDSVDKTEVVDSSDGIAFTALNGNQTRLAQFQDISKLLFCPLIELDENEFVMMNKAKIQIIANRKIIAAEFYKLGSRVRICVDDYLEHYFGFAPSSQAASIHGDPSASLFTCLCLLAVCFNS